MTKYQESFIHATSFIKKLLKIKTVTLLLGQPVVLSIFQVNFYGCYIIIALKVFQRSNGVMQSICSKLDGALLYPSRITLCRK